MEVTALRNELPKLLALFQPLVSLNVVAYAEIVQAQVVERVHLGPNRAEPGYGGGKWIANMLIRG